MFRNQFSSAIVLLALGYVLPVDAGDVLAGQTPLRIMPLGDSITQGYRDSYRRLLWSALKRAGIEADFVGSMNRGYGTESQIVDFDRDHEGHWGWRADHVLAHIDTWAARAKPDVVLMHLGTNDVGGGQDIDDTAQEIARIIQRLRHHNPGVHILLAAIIPVDHERVTQRITRFNEALATLAATVDTPGSRVVLVDQFTGFDAEQDTYDGTHPNEAGNKKIADKWFVAIQALLQQRPQQRPGQSTFYNK
jgi:lysophospholipase L1-like esterase